MPRNAKSLCSRCGLTYVETADLRLVLRRCGKGFSYIDGEGHIIRAKAAKTRISRLAIPPAWTEVRIAAADGLTFTPWAAMAKAACNIAALSRVKPRRYLSQPLRRYGSRKAMKRPIA